MPAEATQATLEIDLGAIAANWRILRDRHPSGPVAGVVKADGYGLGAARVAAALHEAGCRHFFVAYLNEALAIRDVVPDAMLAVLSGLIPGTEDAYVTHGLTPVLGSLDEIDRWRGRQAILHVDTGMSRLGLDARELAILAGDPGRLNRLTVRYVMSHLVSSEVPDDPINRLQRERFAAVRAMLPPAPSSLANSSGIFLGPDFGSDLARPGAALYGVNPTPGQPNPMRNVVRLSVRVLAVRDIPVGTSVGYNGIWTAARPSRIATAALGYADGFHRSLSSRGSACFDGTPVPLVGRVSMDLTTFDVTDHPAVQPGCWLEVLGPHLSPDDVAAAAGTNGYEVLTSLGRRFHRVYRTA
ncbi:alanine racemase [Acidisphaera sp. S103]|uniref:alanine racemase n=1 Tax=Acidisphaera sp. S103 TaxID=1747223 RepID=UPI00131A9F30|nr:alanine racemase [Acidisphaera sp. S103]